MFKNKYVFLMLPIIGGTLFLTGCNNDVKPNPREQLFQQKKIPLEKDTRLKVVDKFENDDFLNDLIARYHKNKRVMDIKDDFSIETQFVHLNNCLVIVDKKYTAFTPVNGEVLNEGFRCFYIRNGKLIQEDSEGLKEDISGYKTIEGISQVIRNNFDYEWKKHQNKIKNEFCKKKDALIEEERRLFLKDFDKKHFKKAKKDFDEMKKQNCKQKISFEMFQDAFDYEKKMEAEYKNNNVYFDYIQFGKTYNRYKVIKGMEIISRFPFNKLLYTTYSLNNIFYKYMPAFDEVTLEFNSIDQLFEVVFLKKYKIDTEDFIINDDIDRFLLAFKDDSNLMIRTSINQNEYQKIVKIKVTDKRYIPVVLEHKYIDEE